MWKHEIKIRRFQVHNNAYLEIMDKFEKEFPIDPVAGDNIYDDMYYYD